MAKRNVSVLARLRKHINLPLFALSATAAVTAELVIVALLWQFEPDHLVGLLWSLLTASLSLAGIVVSGEAARRKTDPRAKVRDTAFVARVVSVLLILPSAFVGGGALALKMQHRAAEEFASSQAYKDTLACSRGETCDSDRAKEQARLDSERGIAPTQVRMDDIAFPGGVLSMFLVMLSPIVAIGVGRGQRDETPAQAKRRFDEYLAAKAQERQDAKNAKSAATREANRKAKAKEDRQQARALGKLKPPNVVEMLRR